MTHDRRNLTPSEAALQLGVSVKALRVYERHGLLRPGRSVAGWGLYGPADLERAGEIVALRTLGLGLAQIAAILAGDRKAGLAAHERKLKAQARRIDAALQGVHRLRSQPSAGAGLSVAFDLPWPWDGERFALGDIGPLTFITGPLGSGKTRFAERLAATLPAASFVGLDRAQGEAIARRLAADAALAERVARAMAQLASDGAESSDALRALVLALEADEADILVVDLVEQGLSEAAQRALMLHLRTRPQRKRALFLMTRSSVILDFGQIRSGEAVILCPANHGPPIRAATYVGGPGHEAVATCLAAPAVRARTAGVMAVRLGAVA